MLAKVTELGVFPRNFHGNNLILQVLVHQILTENCLKNLHRSTKSYNFLSYLLHLNEVQTSKTLHNTNVGKLLKKKLSTVS